MKKRRINSKSLVNSRRIVIKIGSSLIVGESSRRLRSRWLASLSRDISRLRKMGKEIVLVSSGAIALGRDFLSLSKKRLRLDEKQAAAAIGQSRLVNAYQSSLKKFKINIAQVLLTLEDTEKRRRYLNARETIETLIRLSVVPLINENDTVATEEIRFGDNDRLAARVAQMIAADTLVMLSDVEGLYTADPNKDKMARKIDKVYQITPKIYKMAKNTHSDFGSGGMITKIEAAKIALSAGCRMVILFGNKLSPLESIIRSKANEGSWFFPSSDPISSHKKWIAGAINISGKVIIDDGARKALEKGTSLLSVGVLNVRGNFNRGDVINIVSKSGKKLGRGISAFSSKDLNLIKGYKSHDIERILGYRGREEVIHRDYLTLRGQ
jgi:glutamate 5-kinase|tara:strand:+ start:815 stop:1960 length:1146 start_codon:yes stop_codon:yes gene_type:complete